MEGVDAFRAYNATVTADTTLDSVKQFLGMVRAQAIPSNATMDEARDINETIRRMSQSDEAAHEGFNVFLFPVRIERNATDEEYILVYENFVLHMHRVNRTYFAYDFDLQPITVPLLTIVFAEKHIVACKPRDYAHHVADVEVVGSEWNVLEKKWITLLE